MSKKTEKAKAVDRQIAVDWSIKPANGSARGVELNRYMSFLEDKGYDTDALVEKIKSKLEAHVKKSKFKEPHVDPTLDFVDVKAKGDLPNPPGLEFGASLKKVSAEDNEDGKAQPALKFTLSAKFDVLSHGGSKKSRTARTTRRR